MNPQTTNPPSTQATDQPLDSRTVLGQRVDATSYEDAVRRVIEWGRARESRYVCVSTVHMVMEGWDSKDFRACVNGGDLITPDGVPLVWCLKLLGIRSATRVYGPTLTLHLCEAAAKEGMAIGLYGGTEESLKRFVELLGKRFPNLRVACAIAPPFRPLSEEEDAAYCKQMEQSGAQILFVGIGCPKQERWMAAHRGRLNLPMLGVGAAFDFHSGTVKQAPAWMQKAGLEWLFRLCMEPRRLWKRYAWHNPRFIFYFAWQYLSGRG